MKQKPPAEMYEIEIVLAETNPRIWRRLATRADISLATLHRLIQIVMGWTDSHLHQFIGPDETRYAPLSDDMGADWDADVIEEAATRLKDVLPGKGSKIDYEYDFGDGWVHHLKVVAVHPPEPGVQFFRCLAGERACPPEDVGGVWGYYAMLEALLDPEHEEHKSFLEWMGDKSFDPDRFELEKVNKRLARLR